MSTEQHVHQMDEQARGWEALCGKANVGLSFLTESFAHIVARLPGILRPCNWLLAQMIDKCMRLLMTS